VNGWASCSGNSCESPTQTPRSVCFEKQGLAGVWTEVQAIDTSFLSFNPCEARFRQMVRASPASSMYRRTNALTTTSHFSPLATTGRVPVAPSVIVTVVMSPMVMRIGRFNVDTHPIVMPFGEGSGWYRQSWLSTEVLPEPAPAIQAF
jgi:hypothetical protein